MENQVEVMAVLLTLRQGEKLRGGDHSEGRR
jgi:hypothetical protein